MPVWSNPRGASSDAGAEMQRHLFLRWISLVTKIVKRLNPYLHARPCSLCERVAWGVW